MRESVIVVGAGIAGLTAAFRLQQAGFAVQVLEASDHVGGRMVTLDHHGYRIDLAVSVLPTTYHRMLRLIADAGLSDQMLPTSDLVGILRDGRVHRSRSSSKLDGLRSSLLSFGSKLVLMRAMLDAWRARDQLSWDDLGLAATLDHESAADYARRRLNPELLDYVVNPACRGLFLSSPEDVSAVDLLFTLKNILGGGFFSGRTGVDFLAKGLAAQLDVRLNTKVVSVDPSGDSVELSYQTANAAPKTERVAGCVIALPAPQMLNVYPQLDATRRDIASRVGYTNALGVHFGLSRKPVDEPAALIQIPQREQPWLTGVVLDHNKAPGRAPEARGLISTFWQQRWVTQRWDSDDASIAQDAAAELATVLPALVRDIDWVHVQRWRPGIVQARTGAYRDLAAFQPAPNPQPRVQLAADFSSSTSSHTSLCAGENAAHRLTAVLNPTGRASQDFNAAIDHPVRSEEA